MVAKWILGATVFACSSQGSYAGNCNTLFATDLAQIIADYYAGSDFLATPEPRISVAVSDHHQLMVVRHPDGSYEVQATLQYGHLADRLITRFPDHFISVGQPGTANTFFGRNIRASTYPEGAIDLLQFREAPFTPFDFFAFGIEGVPAQKLLAISNQHSFLAAAIQVMQFTPPPEGLTLLVGTPRTLERSLQRHSPGSWAVEPLMVGTLVPGSFRDLLRKALLPLGYRSYLKDYLVIATALILPLHLLENFRIHVESDRSLDSISKFQQFSTFLIDVAGKPWANREELMQLLDTPDAREWISIFSALGHALAPEAQLPILEQIAERMIALDKPPRSN